MVEMRDCFETHEEIETMIVCCFERTSGYIVNRFEDGHALKSIFVAKIRVEKHTRLSTTGRQQLYRDNIIS